MNKLLVTLTRISNGIIVFCLSSMSILVFMNVILRYLFNSGISWAEELSRYFFVWMIFIGAIMVLQNKGHLNVDIVTNAVPLRIKKALLIISNLLVLYVLWLMLDGSWKMTIQNMNIHAPATGIPMFYIYGVGIVMSIGMGIITIVNIIKLFTNKYSDEVSS